VAETAIAEHGNLLAIAEMSAIAEKEPLITTMFMQTTYAEQLAEYNRSWSPLTEEEYFAQHYPPSQGQLPSERPTGTPLETEVHLKSLSKTQLPDGKNSILVDLGSRINIIGKDTAKRFSDAAAVANQEMQYVMRGERLHVNGVGSDAAYCDMQAIMPIAVKFEENEATQETFRANVAEGCGATLPAILGAGSMQEKDSVLILRQGKEMIAFPGPGGYKIEWSPGTRLLPMIAAPSGHLVIPCDRFAELPKNKKSEDQLTFWTDHTQPPNKNENWQ
jgi:hypothetical protein